MQLSPINSVSRLIRVIWLVQKPWFDLRPILLFWICLKGPIHDSDFQPQPRCAARSRLPLKIAVVDGALKSYELVLLWSRIGQLSSSIIFIAGHTILRLHEYFSHELQKTNGYLVQIRSMDHQNMCILYTLFIRLLVTDMMIRLRTRQVKVIRKCSIEYHNVIPRVTLGGKSSFKIPLINRSNKFLTPGMLDRISSSFPIKT